MTNNPTELSGSFVPEPQSQSYAHGAGAIPYERIPVFVDELDLNQLVSVLESLISANELHIYSTIGREGILPHKTVDGKTATKLAHEYFKYIKEECQKIKRQRQVR